MDQHRLVCCAASLFEVRTFDCCPQTRAVPGDGEGLVCGHGLACLRVAVERAGCGYTQSVLLLATVHPSVASCLLPPCCFLACAFCLYSLVAWRFTLARCIDAWCCSWLSILIPIPIPMLGACCPVSCPRSVQLLPCFVALLMSPFFAGSNCPNISQLSNETR